MKSIPLIKTIVTILALLAGLLSLRATTVNFQEGVNGYTGTHDTTVRFATPDRVDGALVNLSVDGSDGGGANHGLMRFTNLFGLGPNQIPPGSVIVSVKLTLTLFDPGDPADIHRMLQPWDESVVTWNLINPDGTGILADDTMAAATPEIPRFTTPVGVKVLDLPPSTVQ